MGLVPAPVRAPFPAGRPPVLHVSQLVVAACTLDDDQRLGVLTRREQARDRRTGTDTALPRRWVGRPTELSVLVGSAIEGSGVRGRAFPVATAAATFDEAAALRPAYGLVSVIVTALVPGAPSLDPGWEWLPDDALRGALGAWDVAAVDAALAKARELLRDNDTALGLLPETFAIGDLRRVYEAFWNKPVDPANFTRRLLKGPAKGFLDEAGPAQGRVGRPTTLYRRGTASAPTLAPD